MTVKTKQRTETWYTLRGSGIYCIGASAYGSSKDRKGPLGYQPNTPTSCST